MLVKLTNFVGEIPKLPTQLLPDNAAQFALNCDFMHGELRGHMNWSDGTVLPTFQGSPIVSVWTENGNDFFGWPYEVVAVKSPVINDIHHRIYYAAVPVPGPVLKVARTATPEGGPQIINAQVPNFLPPEMLDPFLDGLASWLLGVPPPQVQATADSDVLNVSLYDLPAWPGMPNLELRVTFFLEDTAGAIVYQQDITNREQGINPNTGVVATNVFTTNDSAARDTGNLIQDMLWYFGYTPRPYKYYWFNPPDISSLSLSRTVTVTNTDESGNPYIITYGSSTPTPTPTDTGGAGSDGNEA